MWFKKVSVATKLHLWSFRINFLFFLGLCLVWFTLLILLGFLVSFWFLLSFLSSFLRFRLLCGFFRFRLFLSLGLIFFFSLFFWFSLLFRFRLLICSCLLLCFFCGLVLCSLFFRCCCLFGSLLFFFLFSVTLDTSSIFSLDFFNNGLFWFRWAVLTKYVQITWILERNILLWIKQRLVVCSDIEVDG